MDQNYFKWLITEAYQIAKEKGFYPDNKKHNVPEDLAGVLTEVGEAIEAYLIDKRAEYPVVCGSNNYKDQKKVHLDSLYFDMFFKDTFEDEIADIILRLASLAGKLNIQEYKQLHTSFQNHLQQKVKNVPEWLFHFSTRLENIHIVHQLKVDTAGAFGILFGKLWGFCEKQNIDIEKHLSAKMIYNKTRPILHGKG